MKKLLLIALIAIIPAIAGAGTDKRKVKKANKATTEWKYELEAQATGQQGTKVIKVWSYSKKPTVARNQAPKNAIHGVIFKGAPGVREKRISPVLPLVKNPDIATEKADFFTAFFADGGDFMKYVSVTDVANDVVKLDRKTYKVGVTVTVQYDALRKALEKEGVVRSLGSGF